MYIHNYINDSYIFNYISIMRSLIYVENRIHEFIDIHNYIYIYIYIYMKNEIMILIKEKNRG